MTSIIKLQRAFESLKKSIAKPLDEVNKQKLKIAPCITITELVCKSNEKNVLLPFAITSLIQLLEDADSNSRLVIDESINRIIRTSLVNPNYVAKILIALLKILGKQTSARSLKAALWRFSQLSHYIRPQKGKSYVKTLVPIIITISGRKEETIHETLKESLPNIFENIGLFTTDKDIKSLLKVFYHNLNSESVEVRRSAACCIVTVCKFSRKPLFFFSYSLLTLTDFLNENKSIENLEKIWVQGCLFCIHQILPHIVELYQNERFLEDIAISEKLLQVYELSLYFAKFNDHNIITSALETLNQLLQQKVNKFRNTLTVEKGFLHSSFGKAEKHGSTLSLSVLSDVSSIGSTIAQTEDGLFSYYSGSKDDIVLEDTSPSASSVNTDFHESRTKNWIDEQTNCDDNSTFSSSLSVDTSHFANSDDEISTKDNELSISSSTWVFDNQNFDDFGINSPTQTMPGMSDSIANISGISNLSLASCVALELDIGEIFGEEDIPLNYCARLLTSMFLLENFNSNLKPVRVSVKSLALKCLSQLMSIYPRCGLISLERFNPVYKNFNNLLEIILHHASDEDHQIRGIVRLVIANFISSSVYQDCYTIDDEKISILNQELLSELIKVLLKGLEDESSQCIKHSLNAVASCLQPMLQTPSYKLAIPLIEKLFILIDNSYWLIKTKLLEITDDLCYELLYFVANSDNIYQERILEKIILCTLNDPDGRVRTASAKSLSRFVEKSYHPLDNQFRSVFVTYITKINSRYFLDENHRMFLKQRAIQRIVHRLYEILINSSCKFTIFGCCEALYILVSEYQPISYSSGWQCNYSTHNNHSVYSPLNLCEYLLSLVTESSIALNFDSHLHILKITSELFCALCQVDIASKKKDEFNIESTSWSFLTNFELRSLAESYLQHLTRLLSVFNDIIIGAHVKSLASTDRFCKPTTLPLPVDQLLTNKSTSHNIVRCRRLHPSKKHHWRFGKNYTFSQYNHLPIYMELRNALKSAFANYEVTLKSEASEKFLQFLNALLENFNSVLDFTTTSEVDRICQHVLLFLRNVSVFSPALNIRCVKQLLKSVFGSNLICEIIQMPSDTQTNNEDINSIPFVDFCTVCIEKPYEEMKVRLDSKDRSCVKGNSFWLKKELSMEMINSASPTKQIKRISNLNMLPTYIKLFEPNVIQSLRLYTVTRDAELQSEVLSLLTALIQLKVNYCLLDSEQVFIKFVLSQFQLMEEERLTNMDTLLPSIFNFLIHLASEKHSKPMMTVPKIIQLCDLLIASIQATSHSVIAIELVARHVFTKSSAFISSGEIKELETQRDVLFAMILKLICNFQTFPLLSLILDNSDDESRQLRSKQIVDVFFSALDENKIFISDDDKIISSIENLFSSLHPTSVDFERLWRIILTMYFSNCHRESSQWLFVVESLLIALLKECDENRLLSIVESSTNHPALVNQDESDPLCVGSGAKCHLSPQNVFSKFLFQFLQQILKHVTDIANGYPKNSPQLKQILRLLSDYIHILTFISQSGCYDTIKSNLLEIHCGNYDDDAETCFSDITTMLRQIQIICPVISLKWRNVFSPAVVDGVNGNNVESLIIFHNWRSSFISEILKHGMFLLICKFESHNMISSDNQLEKFLKDQVSSVVANLQESAVCELLECIRRSESASRIFLQSLLEFYSSVIDNDTKVLKILRCFHYCSDETSGQRLLFCFQSNLIYHSNSAISSAVFNILADILEDLRTVDSKEKFDKCVDTESVELTLEYLKLPQNSFMKHWFLMFRKLISKWCINDKPSNEEHELEVERMSLTNIDEQWFFEMLKNRCCTTEEIRYFEMASLMSKLSLKSIQDIQQLENFDKMILRSCILVGSQLSEQKKLHNSDKYLSFELSDLFIASTSSLLSFIGNFTNQFPRSHRVYIPVGRQPSEEENIYKQTVDQLFASGEFKENFKILMPTVNQCMIQIRKFISKIDFSQLIPKENLSSVVSFMVTCIEFVHWLVRRDHRSPKSLIVRTLECAESVLRIENVLSEIKSSHIGSIVSCICYLTEIFTMDIIKIRSNPILENIEDDSNGLRNSVHVFSTFVEFIISKNNDPVSSSSFFKCVVELVRNMGRSTLIYNYIRIPLELWRYVSSDEIILKECLTLNTISEHFLQDCDILQNFISRFIFCGWKCRQQFEETWMTLLIAFNSLPEQDTSELEIDALSHIHAISISAVTSLLVQSLYYPNPGNKMTAEVFHVSRNSLQFCQNGWMSKLSNVNLDLKLKADSEGENVFLLFNNINKNLERLHDSDSFGFNQISIDYLLKTLDSPISPTKENVENISIHSNGLDILRKERLRSVAEVEIDTNSCVYFLMDFYSRWLLKPYNQSIQIVLETVNSLAVISDLFVEMSQYVWLLECCIILWKKYSRENEAVCAYLTLLICKATSVSIPKDLDTRKLVIKILKSGLDNQSTFVRSASSRGLLYLLENIFTQQNFSSSIEVIGGLLREDVLSLCVHYVLENLEVDSIEICDESTTCCVISVAFYLIENKAREDITCSLIDRLLKLSVRACKLKYWKTYTTVIQGLYNLILLNDDSFKRYDNEFYQLVKEILSISECTSAVSICSLQILVALMYTSDNFKRNSNESIEDQFDTEKLINKIEKISVFFERIKKSDQFEAGLISTLLQRILCDFYEPSEILNKIISEVLSPQQPHFNLLAEVIFKVFQNAIQCSQFDVISEWVLLISNNFVNYSTSKAVFLFTSFFVSASTNEWLTRLFPLLITTTRPINCDVEDLFHLSAVHFYQQLKTEKQRKTLLSTLEKASVEHPTSVFSQVLRRISFEFSGDI